MTTHLMLTHLIVGFVWLSIPEVPRQWPWFLSIIIRFVTTSTQDVLNTTTKYTNDVICNCFCWDILHGLHADDWDGLMVLGHELLLLACSRCCKKRGGSWASCHPGTLSLDHLPACSRDTLECAVCSSKDTVALEHLAWAVYDNQLRPGKSLFLSGFEGYGQVLQHLVDKAFKGLQTHCLVHTSAVFKPVERVKLVVTVPCKSPQTEKYPMTRDVREDFTGD